MAASSPRSVVGLERVLGTERLLAQNSLVRYRGSLGLLMPEHRDMGM